jgi:hypothetical protein
MVQGKLAHEKLFSLLIDYYFVSTTYSGHFQ